MTEAVPVRVEQRGTIAVWILDRPPHNALSREALLALGRLAREAADNPSVRAVVLSASGDRAFCAGADLKERRTMTDADVRAQLELYRSELGPVDRCPKPIVAALNGHALGGGVELALCCDLRLAAPHAELAMPETSLAVIPGAGGTQRLPRLIGEGRAKELILLGRRLSAHEALAWGLVNRVSPPGVPVVDDAVAWLTPVATGAPVAMLAALESIDRAADTQLEVGLALEKTSYERVLTTEDRREGLAAFAEKRKPSYRGI